MRAAKGRVHVRPPRRSHELRADDQGELGDRLGVVAAPGGLEPEHDSRPRRGRHVRLQLGVLEDLVDDARVAGPVEPQPQLLLGEAQLAQLGAAELGAGLEVLGRDAELLGEHPERLHRRCPRAGFDPGDVGVGDPGGRQVSLGRPALEPQPAQSLPDRLRLGDSGFGTHGPR